MRSVFHKNHIVTIYLFCGFLLASTMAYGQESLGIAEDYVGRLQLNTAQSATINFNKQRAPYEWTSVYANHPVEGLFDRKFRLDSSLCETGLEATMQFEPSMKVMYDYTAEGLTRAITYQSVQAGQASNYLRRTYRYDNAGLVETYRSERWNDNSNTWQLDFEATYTYNGQEQLEGSVQRSDISGTESMSRQSFSYDTTNSVTQILSQKMVNGSWENESRQSFQNNSLGIPEQITSALWENGSWKVYVEETSLLGNFGLEWDAYRISQRNETSDQMEFVMQENYNYDNRGFWSGLTQQVWNGSTWENLLRQQFSYKKGEWQEWKQQVWVDGAWQFSSRHIFNDNGDLREERFQVYDVANSSWENFARLQTQFDEREVLRQETGPQLWTENGWLNTADSKKCTHFVNEAQTTTAIRPKLPGLDCLMANPYSAGNRIHCTAMEPGNRYQVNLMDLNGRTLIAKEVNGGQDFSLETARMSTGIYYLHILENGKPRFSQKLLINN